MTRAILVALAIQLASAPAHAQNRGVYPLGMTVINAGAMPEPGLTYANQLLLYARNEAKDATGQTVATGANAVLMDMNTLTWVAGSKAFGGRYAVSATLPVARNNLTSDFQGPISGGSGLADSYYLPVILGWSGERAALRAMYGFLAPTGRFSTAASNNVGSGYWTHTISTGQTYYLARNQVLTASAFEMYEFHTMQHGSGIEPGDTFDLDYSLMASVRRSQSLPLQIGLVGYEQRQTTAKSGPGLTPAQAAARYAVNSFGVALQVGLPKWRANLGLRYFKEFANRSTFQGYSLQAAGAIAF